MGERRTSRVNALTGIRILAAVAVFLSHIAGSTGSASVPGSGHVWTFMAAGYNGVTLFFVLSGFVLAWNYTDRLTPLSRRAVWSFTVARFARIYPMYLVALAVALVPILLTTGVGWDLGLHIFALQAWNSDVAVVTGYNGPGWSISVEFFLYACFPLLIVAMARIRRSARALSVVAVSCLLVMFVLAWWFTATGRAEWPSSEAGSAHRWLYLIPVTRLGDFVVGIAMAMLAQAQRPRAWIASVAQAVAVVGFVALMAWPALLFTAWSWDVAYMLPAALLLWGLASGPRTVLARALGTRLMVLLGEASFAFYLLHVPMLHLLAVHEDSLLGRLVRTGAQFVVILLAAVIAHLLIERPAQRWLRRNLNRTPAATVIVAALVMSTTGEGPSHPQSGAKS
jgi:peptidoglycan/LPS O-acetylase OafA/YrhL